MLRDRFGTIIKTEVNDLKDGYGDTIDNFKSISIRNSETNNYARFNFNSNNQILDLMKELWNLFCDKENEDD